jgi:hypothetical protein
MRKTLIPKERLIRLLCVRCRYGRMSTISEWASELGWGGDDYRLVGCFSCAVIYRRKRSGGRLVLETDAMRAERVLLGFERLGWVRGESFAKHVAKRRAAYAAAQAAREKYKLELAASRMERTPEQIYAAKQVIETLFGRGSAL